MKPPGCTETDLDKCDIPQPGRRKRGVPEVDFHPKYVWHQDKIPRPRKCCITYVICIHIICFKIVFSNIFGI